MKEIKLLEEEHKDILFKNFHITLFHEGVTTYTYEDGVFTYDVSIICDDFLFGCETLLEILSKRDIKYIYIAKYDDAGERVSPTLPDP